MTPNTAGQPRVSASLNKRGFTLIEVVLVLAIAGLLFLLAFIAYRQVSANRRDTKRRTSVAQVLAEVQNASGDGVLIADQNALTGGAVSSSGGFVGKYLKAPLAGPTGYYAFKYQAAPASGQVVQTTVLDQMQITHDAKCGDSPDMLLRSNGSYAVMLRLEKGVVCRDD